MFKKAVKHEAKLRLSIAGPSGSGKTFTALTFASALNNGGGVAVVDTEHGSASKYADQFDFDVLELSNFHPSNYVKAIEAAAQAGYDVVVLDSITHAWSGKGGILDIVGGNYTKWKEANPIEQQFIEAIISAPMHVIATMRAKTQYEVEMNERGKPTPRKVGMGAIQRDGMEYEFDIACMMDVQNTLYVEKSRCPAVAGETVNKPGAAFLNPVVEWLNGAPLEVADAETLAALEAAGNAFYGEKWNTKAIDLARSISKQRTGAVAQLTTTEAKSLIDGISKRADRVAA